MACAPAPAGGERTSAPGGVSVPGMDSVEAVAAGRAALSQVAGPSWMVLAHWSAVLPAKAVHIEHVRCIAELALGTHHKHGQALECGGQQVAVAEASNTSSCASLKPTKLASMRPLGEQ